MYQFGEILRGGTLKVLPFLCNFPLFLFELLLLLLLFVFIQIKCLKICLIRLIFLWVTEVLFYVLFVNKKGEKRTAEKGKQSRPLWWPLQPLFFS